jgi:hypothetical protein
VAGSSPWPTRNRPAGCTRAARGCWPPPSPRRRRTGPWRPWQPPPRPRASGWAAARSAASSSANGCAGGRPARGRKAPTRTSPQKGQGHRPLHRAARGDDGELAPTSWARSSRAASHPHRAGHPTVTASRRRWSTAVAWTRPPVYGGLRVGDGHKVTMTAPSRNSVNYQRFLGLVEQANPTGTVMVITDNLSSHTSASTRTWLADHPASSTPSFPSGPAGSTCRRAGGGCFAARRWPGRPSPTRARSPWRPGWRPAGSTPARARGCGAAHHRPHATNDESSCTAFEERSTKSVSPTFGWFCYSIRVAPQASGSTLRSNWLNSH